LPPLTKQVARMIVPSGGRWQFQLLVATNLSNQQCSKVKSVLSVRWAMMITFASGVRSALPYHWP